MRVGHANSLPVDIRARELRERFELACVRTDDQAAAEAARELVRFCSENPEYRLMWLVGDASKPAAKKTIRSQFPGRCRTCSASHVPGDEVCWTPGVNGVECVSCGGKT